MSRDRPLPLDLNITQLDEDSLRKINYEFSEDVLKLPKIMTTCALSTPRLKYAQSASPLAGLEYLNRLPTPPDVCAGWFSRLGLRKCATSV